MGNLAQIMRGILFPSSNLIFAVQGQDPAAPKPPYNPGTGGFNWADWGAGIYPGWELVDYKASQTRKQDAVSEATNQLADACLNCHVVYRDKEGGTAANPSNKAARCIP